MSDTPQLQLNIDDLPPGEIAQRQLNGKNICVANVDGQIYALSDTCTHANIPMSSGALDGHELICPWHGAAFDVRSGVPTCGPATVPLRTYHVTLEGEQAIITEKN